MIKDTMNYILPKMRYASCVSYYSFDSTEPKLMTNRVTHIQNHVGGINPSQINSCTGTAVRFNNNHLGGEVAETDVLAAVNSGDISVTLLVRTNETYDPYTNQERAFFYIGGDQDVSAIEHIEIGNNANFLYVRWTASGSAPQVVRFDGDTVPTMQLYLHTWTLVNVVFNDTDQTMKVYVNGTLLHTVNSTNLMTTDPTTALVLGGRFEDGSIVSNWLGDLDCVIIDNAPLTSEDIEEDFRRFSGHLHPSYVASKVVLKGDLDLSNVHGYDMLLNAKVTIDTDNGIRKADIECVREIGKVSLAPLVSDTPLALPNAFDPDITKQYIDINTPVEISTVRSPIGHIPRENNYAPLLKGQIDDFDPTPDGTTIKFSCRDRMGLLVDYFIPKPILYARELDVEEEFKQGTYDHIVIDELIGDNSDLVVTGGPPRFEVDQPYDSEWKLMDYEQRPEPLFTALKAIANGLGWVIAYEWNPYLRTWRMRYYEPQRLKNNTDNILKPYDILSQSSFNTTAANIRNVVRVSFSDFEAENNVIGSTRTPIVEDGATTSSELFGKDSEGNRLPGFVEYVDTASVAKYGRRYMQMNEFTTRGIGRIEEASKLAISALRELKQPDIESSLQIRCMPEIDIDDIIYMKQDLKIHTTDLRMAVKSISHDLGLKSKTSLTLKGKPGWGHRKYLQLEARAGQAPTPLSSPDVSLLDKSSRDLLPLVRGMMENNRTLTENGGFQITNNNLDNRSRGERFAPDGWFFSERDSILETAPKVYSSIDDGVTPAGFSYEDADNFTYLGDRSVRIPTMDGDTAYGMCTEMMRIPMNKFLPEPSLLYTPVQQFTEMQMSAYSYQVTSVGDIWSSGPKIYMALYDNNKEFIKTLAELRQGEIGHKINNYVMKTDGKTSKLGMDDTVLTTADPDFGIPDEAVFCRFLFENDTVNKTLNFMGCYADLNTGYAVRTMSDTDAFGPLATDRDWLPIMWSGSSLTGTEGFRTITGTDRATMRADTGIGEDTGGGTYPSPSRIYIEQDGSYSYTYSVGFRGMNSNSVCAIRLRVHDASIGAYVSPELPKFSADNVDIDGSGFLFLTNVITVSNTIKLTKGSYIEPEWRVSYDPTGAKNDLAVQSITHYGTSLSIKLIK